jgi:hypothetical protein
MKDGSGTLTVATDRVPSTLHRLFPEQARNGMPDNNAILEACVSCVSPFNQRSQIYHHAAQYNKTFSSSYPVHPKWIGNSSP